MMIFNFQKDINEQYVVVYSFGTKLIVNEFRIDVGEIQNSIREKY